MYMYDLPIHRNVRQAFDAVSTDLSCVPSAYLPVASRDGSF